MSGKNQGLAGIAAGRDLARKDLFLRHADAYRYLPKSVSYLPEPEVMLENLASAGFEQIQRTLLSGGISQLITATRSAERDLTD